MKGNLLKGISLLVIFVLLISQAGATPPAAEETAPAEETTELGVPYSDIPEGLSPQMRDEADCVARLRGLEEDTNTAIFA